MPNELETVDLEKVDIMAAGAKVRGSRLLDDGRIVPGEVETFTEEKLREIAEASNAALKEVSPFVKIGHSPEQRLARASGLYGDDEKPATGWLTNFRVEDGKLYTDIKAVPKKLAQLIKAGAFGKRSPEVKPYESQSDGTVYPDVVRALSLLGAKAPAFKTLDEIHAVFSGADHEPTRELLYADAEPPADEELRIVEYAAGDIIWEPEAGFQDLLSDLNALLNPDDSLSNTWAQDVSTDRTRALICEGGNDYWIAPIVVGADGEPTLSDRSQWTMAEQAWVEASQSEQAGEATDATSTGSGSEYGEGDRNSRAAADTRRRMPKQTDNKPDTIELNAEDAKAFSEALGLDEFDPGKAREAIDALKAKSESGDGSGEGDGGSGDEGGGSADVPKGMRLMSEADVEELKTMAKEGVGAAENLRVMARDSLIESAAKEGRINPSKEERERWTKRYNEAPEVVAELLSELPVNEDFKKVYGAEETGDETGDNSTATMVDEAQIASLFSEMDIPYIPTPAVAALMARGQRREGEVQQ